MVGVEVKVKASVQHRDFDGLRRLADLAAAQFISGCVPYDGNETLPQGPRPMGGAGVAPLQASLGVAAPPTPPHSSKGAPFGSLDSAAGLLPQEPICHRHRLAQFSASLRPELRGSSAPAPVVKGCRSPLSPAA